METVEQPHWSTRNDISKTVERPHENGGTAPRSAGRLPRHRGITPGDRGTLPCKPRNDPLMAAEVPPRYRGTIPLEMADRMPKTVEVPLSTVEQPISRRPRNDHLNIVNRPPQDRGTILYGPWNDCGRTTDFYPPPIQYGTAPPEERAFKGTLPRCPSCRALPLLGSSILTATPPPVCAFQLCWKAL